MTITELESSILLSLYRRYLDGSTTPVTVDTLCSDYHIDCDDQRQITVAVESLSNKAFIEISTLHDARCTIKRLTPFGIEAAEHRIKKGSSDTSRDTADTKGKGA